MTIQELANIIQSNPGCVAIIDNDNWSIYSQRWFAETRDGIDCSKGDEWYYDRLKEDERLVDSYDISDGGDRYGYSVLLALALTAGIHIENV